MMKKLSILFWLFSFATFAQDFFASRTLIATLSSNIDPRITQIVLESDATSGIGHLIKVRDHIETAFSIANLNEGIVFERERGRDIFTFESQNFDPITGGLLTLTFLHNGILGNYRQVELEIRMTTNGFKFFHNNNPFSKMVAIGNHAMGKVVGIKRFEFSE